MSKPRSERSRWVRLYTFSITKHNAPEWSGDVFAKAHAIVEAFGKVGRVVRVVSEDGMLVLRARR